MVAISLRSSNQLKGDLFTAVTAHNVLDGFVEM